MASDNATKILNYILQALPDDRTPTEEEISILGQGFRNMFPVSDDEYARILNTVHSKHQLKMDVGEVIVGDDEPKPWLSGRKASIDPYYWDRYEKYLLKTSWTPKVITTLDRVTDEILDLLGNPENEAPWKRRGLVMGDVQSGKTSNYTALCCKAADAGYRLVIVLSGTLENLRKQTQERLDAGLVGKDSSGILTQQRKDKLVGVGLIDRRRSAGVLTSVKNDFKSDLINNLGFSLEVFSETILLVVKKNRQILENLESWLRTYNADNDGLIDLPMLLIDDEADNASVNTKPNVSDPTTINKRIRALLRLFKRSSYVGFTATPFANIFIDPDTEDEMIGDDLFPKDFIYSLEPASNYVGAGAIFSEDGSEQHSLREIYDAEPYFPDKHKSDLPVPELPPSLYKALNTFIICNAIRDLRGDQTSHRSMLVNVSRYNNVQNQVADLLDYRLKIIQQDVRHYSRKKDALKNQSVRDIYDTFIEEYSDQCEFSWEEVLQVLIPACIPITVKSINQRSRASSLDYAANHENGLRVVAVGGDSLSRGLTLEGLCVSYFYRNSQAYDTLMQMGRWFGYRDGYRDLCRIWMSPDAIDWYGHISLAIQELRHELRKMRIAGKKPIEFGLKVRAHPDALIVTARNKMRTSRQIERLITVSAQGFETPKLYATEPAVEANARAVEGFLKSVKESEALRKDINSGNPFWTNVSKELVIRLLREFTVHPLNMTFHGDSIADYLEKSVDEALQNWDVVIPQGDGFQREIAGVKFTEQERSIELRDKVIHVSGKRSRVGSRGIEREGIDPDDVQRAVEEFKQMGKTVPDWKYRDIRKNPLLLLHFIQIKGKDDVISNISNNSFAPGGRVPLTALGLSFPVLHGSVKQTSIPYRINLVLWKEMFESEQDEGTDDDDDYNS